MLNRFSTLGIVFWLSGVAFAMDPLEGWTTHAPRDEISPTFAYDANGGPKSDGSLIIQSRDRAGDQGRWTKTVSVEAGKYYRFSVQRRMLGVESARRYGVVRIHWSDANGKKVHHAEPSFVSYADGNTVTAEPEYPLDGSADKSGWTELSGVYLAPPKAAKAIIELELRWAANAKLEWASIVFEETERPASRRVRLAAVHFVPREAKSPIDRREAFIPLVEEAARQKADLIVLPEVLTYGSGSTYLEVAEPIPGPSTEFFGELAKRCQTHLVPGLVERDGTLIYNVAVLIGPDGNIIGKYRKVCLPRGEIEAGIVPGSEYPVFTTRFGKVGMMVCYDGFFPEVARALSINGAEVIAWPVMGCNPRGASRLDPQLLEHDRSLNLDPGSMLDRGTS